MKSNFFKKNNLILICGPTAVGKSDLAFELASVINGEIVNADSMQVYKYFNILTSQPSRKQKTKIKHHLYNYIELNKKMSAGKWREDACYVIEKILQNKKTPIVVGGSGLYIDFLLKGMSIIPKVPNEIRFKVEKELNKSGLELLFSRLEKFDPKYSIKISSNDKQRIIRSLEVYYHTNIPYSHFHEKKKINTPYRFFKILVMPERSIIRKNCANRFESMINKGLVEEVKRNHKRVGKSTVFKAIGYDEILSYLNKKTSLEEAKNLSINKTRKYAKRQSTWFRNRFDADIIVNSRKDIPLLLESLSKII